MATNAEVLAPSGGYTADLKADGSKMLICKQCGKEIKSEQSMKIYITSKHKHQAIKRVISSDTSGLETENVKRQKTGRASKGDDSFDFEFDPLQSDTSSQIAGVDLNITEICSKKP